MARFASRSPGRLFTSDGKCVRLYNWNLKVDECYNPWVDEDFTRIHKGPYVELTATVDVVFDTGGRYNIELPDGQGMIGITGMKCASLSTSDRRMTVVLRGGIYCPSYGAPASFPAQVQDEALSPTKKKYPSGVDLALWLDACTTEEREEYRLLKYKGLIEE